MSSVVYINRIGISECHLDTGFPYSTDGKENHPWVNGLHVGDEIIDVLLEFI